MDAMDTQSTQIGEEQIGRAIIGAALKVHTALGPGLLETVYSSCLAREIMSADLAVRREVGVHISYNGFSVRNAYRIDLLVGERVVVEVKAQEALTSVHRAQLLTYLKLGRYKLGYLLNFNVAHMRDGIARMVNGL